MTRSVARTLLILAAAAVLVPVVLVATWWAVERTRDPMAAISRHTPALRVLRDSTYEAVTAAGEVRRYRDLVWDAGEAGTIRLTTSEPAQAAPGPLPVVFILAGLRTGRESLAVVPEHGPNLLVGYEYPYDPEDWGRGGHVREALRIRRAILNVPAQVVAAVRELRRREETDDTRSALLGYSFGALFVPATQRLAMSERAAFEAVILAYAGVDLRALIAANLRIEPAWLRGPAALLAATALHVLEPARHLPELTGRFLVIRGAQDERIPPVLSARLAELTPEPKDVVTIEAGHMGPEAPEVTERVVRISQEWLVRIGAIDP